MTYFIETKTETENLNTNLMQYTESKLVNDGNLAIDKNCTATDRTTEYGGARLTMPPMSAPAGTTISGMVFHAQVACAVILAPYDLVLSQPATLALRYTANALKRDNLSDAYYSTQEPDFSPEDLVVAYWDSETASYKYVESVLDTEAKTLTADIDTFYPGGYVLMPRAYVLDAPAQ